MVSSCTCLLPPQRAQRTHRVQLQVGGEVAAGRHLQHRREAHGVNLEQVQQPHDARVHQLLLDVVLPHLPRQRRCISPILFHCLAYMAQDLSGDDVPGPSLSPSLTAVTMLWQMALHANSNNRHANPQLVRSITVQRLLHRWVVSCKVRMSHRMLDVALALVLVPLRVELVHLHRNLAPLHQIHRLTQNSKDGSKQMPNEPCLVDIAHSYGALAGTLA